MIKRKNNKQRKQPPQKKQQAQQNNIPSLRTLIFAAFFLSGFAGLMHQVVWTKLLVQLIGATSYAQVVVLAVFMGGLALGAVLFGRRSDQDSRPLRTYLILELLVAGYCLLLPILLYLAGLGYVSLASHFFEQTSLTLLLRFVLVTLLILFPAVLMGGTLPVLARYLIGSVEQTQRQVASLYALNSFGAVLGAGFAGFVLLPMFGIYTSLVTASLLNLLAGALVFRGARRERKNTLTSSPLPREQPTPTMQTLDGEEIKGKYQPIQYTVTLFALALSGFAAMGYEVLFTRIIALSFGSSTYSFTVMLMTFITGIGIGSAIVSRLTVKRPLWLLGVSQFAVVATLLIATPLIARMPYLIGLLRIELQDLAMGFELFQLGKAILCLAVMLVPTICMGISFPLVAQVQTRNQNDIGTRIGTTNAWNTMGNVLGVAITSLVLLPKLGLRDSFHFNLVLNFIAGGALLFVAVEAPITRRILTGATACLVVSTYLLVGTGWSEGINLARNHLRLRTGPTESMDAATIARHPASSFAAWTNNYVLRPDEFKHFFFEEDAHATVVVAGNDQNVQLYVNSKPDASTTTDLDTQLLVAHAPLFLAPDAQSILIIGHGSGITAGSVMRHPVKTADLVEISESVLNADVVFANDNYHVLSDPRTHIYVEDGQSFLSTAPHRYDIIISQPPNPWIAGVGGLFTVEYFEKARDKLNNGGLFTFWFHAYEQSDEAVRLITRTAGAVFPNVMLFADDDLGNFIAVASMLPIEPDFAAMEQRFLDPTIQNDLARLGMQNLTSLLSHHRVSQNQFKRLIDSGPLNTVHHQQLEYIAPRSFFNRSNSFVLDQFDPLIKATAKHTDVLLDQYIDYRAATQNPITKRELVDTATYAANMGGYGRKVAQSIIYRIPPLPTKTEPNVNQPDNNHQSVMSRDPNRIGVVSELKRSTPIFNSRF
ncbi:MAG: spermidine synthase [Candidatus Azotimanducaceae bacterium]|jgi:spermidine synthase